MRFAAVEPLLFVEQRHIVECGLRARKVADRAVQALFQQQALQFGRRGAGQFQLHRFFALAKTGNGLGDAQGDALVLVLGQADAYRAQQSAGHAIGLLAELFDLQQQALGRLQQQLAFLGQAEAAFASAAQAIAQARFQPRHLLADAGLAQPQHALGGTEPAGLDYSDEQPQQVQVRVVQLSEHHIAPGECQLRKVAIFAM